MCVDQNRPQPASSSCLSQRPISGSPIFTKHFGVSKVIGRSRVPNPMATAERGRYSHPRFSSGKASSMIKSAKEKLAVKAGDHVQHVSAHGPGRQRNRFQVLELFD